MAFYGIGGGSIATSGGSTPLIRFNHVDVSHGGDNSWQTAYTTSLGPGMYMIGICYSPSTSSGDYPNSDPDKYQILMNLDGSGIGNTSGGLMTGEENPPHTYQMTTSFNCVIGWASGTKSLTWLYRTTDPDLGGVRGKLTVSCSRIMDYS